MPRAPGIGGPQQPDAITKGQGHFDRPIRAGIIHDEDLVRRTRLGQSRIDRLPQEGCGSVTGNHHADCIRHRFSSSKTDVLMLRSQTRVRGKRPVEPPANQPLRHRAMRLRQASPHRTNRNLARYSAFQAIGCRMARSHMA